jgi:histidinol-phosphate aminotransferase
MTAPRYRWQPTTADIARRLGISPREVVRFDHNTSPFPTDWAPGLLSEAARHLNEYPGADYRPIRDAAAKYVGVEPENVVAGAGVDELILLAAKAFVDSACVAVTLTPTYPLYEIATLQQRGRLVTVPMLPPDFGYPADPLLAAARDADLVWLCIPSNPIGTRMDDELVRRVVETTRGIVALDAAYAEFAGDSWAPWVGRHPNLIVMHTLSKGFGLAGARVGFAIAGTELVDAIDGVRPPGSIASLSADLAVAALDEPSRMERRVARLLKERDRLAARLANLGIEVMPSSANFLLCRVGTSATALADGLLESGLVVRRFDADSPLAGYLRFTVRSPEEDDRLIEALWRQLP